MKIIPYIHRNAPELCYFTVNGIRYTEKPMMGLQVDWYKHLCTDRGENLVSAIRKKHFAKTAPKKIARIEITYPSGYEYLNKVYNGCINSYADLMVFIRTQLTDKHGLNGGKTYNKYNSESDSFTVEPMPIPTMSVETKLQYIKVN